MLRNNYAQNVALANAVAQAAEPAPRPPALHAPAGARRAARPRRWSSCPTDRQIRERLDSRARADPARAGRAARLHQDHGGGRADRAPTCRTTRTCAGCCTPTSRQPLRERFPEHDRRRTRCAARSSRPCWSTTRSTPAVRPSCTGCGRRPGPRPRRSSGRRPRPARSSGSARSGTPVEALDNKVDAAVQTRMRLHSRRLVERGTRWLLDNRPQPLELAETIDFFAERVDAVLGAAAEAAARRGPGVVPAASATS